MLFRSRRRRGASRFRAGVVAAPLVCWDIGFGFGPAFGFQHCRRGPASHRVGGLAANFVPSMASSARNFFITSNTENPEEFVSVIRGRCNFCLQRIVCGYCFPQIYCAFLFTTFVLSLPRVPYGMLISGTGERVGSI